MNKCKAVVPIPGLNFTRFRQCSRAAVADGGMFCKQHSTEGIRRREEKRAEAVKKRLRGKA